MNHIEAFTHPAVLDIPLDPEAEQFDAHNTGGEHANKEYGAWQQYLYHLEKSGGALPKNIDEPFRHYLLKGPGAFYRAYPYDSNNMYAGMTVVPTEDRGLRVDSMYAPDSHGITVSRGQELAANTLIAAGLHKILTKNIFGYYCGQYGLPAARYLDFPLKAISNILRPHPDVEPHRYNRGVLRGLHDFAIATESGFRIPLPGLVIGDFDDIDEAKLEEIKAPMPDDFIGAVRYSMRADPNVHIEELFRHKTHIGSLVSTYNEETYSSNQEALDAEGQTIEFESPDRDHATHRVRFLKALAENSEATKRLILA